LVEKNGEEMSGEIKELTVTYTVKLATYTPGVLVMAREDLYTLLDEVFYNNAQDVTGASFLVKTTELRIKGEE
jgi:hypothetical protein